MRCSACNRKAIGAGVPDGFGRVSPDCSVREVQTCGPKGSTARALLCRACVKMLELSGYECVDVPKDPKVPA